MSSPIKGNLSKRQFCEVIEKENGFSPINSPHKLSPSPKKTRTILIPSINGVSVEKQAPSPTKLLPKRLSDLFEEASSEPSPAKRDLTSVFLQGEITVAENNQPIEIFKRKAPTPPAFNITSLLAQREERLASLRFDVEYWNQQAILQKSAQDSIKCLSLAAAGANHNPKQQKELLESLAIKQLESEKYHDALMTCDQIDRFFPEDFTPILLIRGFCHLKLKKYENCYGFYKDAMEKGESLSSKEEENITDAEWEKHFNLISISIDALQTAKDNEQATRDLDLTLDLLELIYMLQCCNNQYDEAITTLEEQETLLPGSTLTEQGFCYCNLDLPEEGVAMFRSALQPQNRIFLQSQPFKFLMISADKLKNLSQSLGDTDLLEFSLGYCNLALLQQMNQDEQEEALTLKYDCEFILEHYSQALATMQAIEALVPKKPYYLLFQAICHFKLLQPEEGARLLEKAFKLKPNMPAINVKILYECSRELLEAGHKSLSKNFLEWGNEIYWQNIAQ